jgi:hypothetical protein
MCAVVLGHGVRRDRATVSHVAGFTGMRGRDSARLWGGQPCATSLAFHVWSKNQATSQPAFGSLTAANPAIEGRVRLQGNEAAGAELNSGIFSLRRPSLTDQNKNAVSKEADHDREDCNPNRDIGDNVYCRGSN